MFVSDSASVAPAASAGTPVRNTTFPVARWCQSASIASLILLSSGCQNQTPPATSQEPSVPSNQQSLDESAPAETGGLMDRLKSAGSALKEKVETETAGMQEELRNDLTQRIERIENDLGRFDGQADQLSAEAQQQWQKLRPEIVQAKDELLEQLQRFTKEHPEEWKEIRGELVRKGKDLMRLWQQAQKLFSP